MTNETLQLVAEIPQMSLPATEARQIPQLPATAPESEVEAAIRRRVQVTAEHVLKAVSYVAMNRTARMSEVAEAVGVSRTTATLILAGEYEIHVEDSALRVRRKARDPNTLPDPTQPGPAPEIVNSVTFGGDDDPAAKAITAIHRANALFGREIHEVNRMNAAATREALTVPAGCAGCSWWGRRLAADGTVVTPRRTAAGVAHKYATVTYAEAGRKCGRPLGEKKWPWQGQPKALFTESTDTCGKRLPLTDEEAAELLW